MNEKQNKIFEMIQILKKVQEEKERSLKIKNENTSFKVEDVSNVVKENSGEYENNSVEVLNETLKKVLKEVAEPLQEIEFNRENYNALFPRNRIKTPIENVKLGEHQFEKLDVRERKFILKAAHDTLATPDLIINETKKNAFGEDESSHIYLKSYFLDDKVHGIQSVVVAIDGENVSVSSHIREINNFVNKIKKPDQLLFAAAKVRLLVEQHTKVKLPQSVVNPTRETEYVNSLDNSISQNEEKSNDTLEDKIKNRFEKSLKKINNLDINNENYKETLDFLTKLEKLLNNTEVEKGKENNLNQNIENQEIEEKEDKKIIFGQTVLPPVAAFTKDGQLKNFDNLVIQSFDEKNKTYVVSNEEESLIFPEETVDSLLNPKVIHKVENDKEIAQVEGQGLGVVLNDDEKGIKGTEIPEFSIKTQDDEFRTYKGFVVSKYNPAEKSYTLKNGDESVTITESTFKEAISPERFKNQFDENTPAYKKLLKTQYESFFETRDNDACNFVHNFSVYCRKEANSPCDALKIAKMITQRMPKDEVQKTKNLINKMKYEDESLNEFLVRKYHEAVKAIPLNEDYIKYHQPENVITRPFYDTITAKGQNIENDLELKRTNADYNLKIGGTLKNVNLKQDKVFGIGKEAVHYDELTVVSASKEGNSITLMDKNKSFFELPRDTVLKAYKQQALAEIKQEQKHSRRNEIEFSYSM